MSGVSNRQLLERVESRMQQITIEEAALHKLQRTLGADTARQDEELEGAWDHLAEVLVPRLDVAGLDRLAAGLHLPAIHGQAVATLRHQTLARAAHRRTALLADPRLQQAEAIENEVSIRLAELNEAAAPLQTSTRALENEPLYMELLAHRYGTPEYAVRFWQMSFYKHWKHADIIVEVYGPRLKRESFADIVALYVRERAALDELRQNISAQQGRVAEIKALRDELAVCETTVATIDGTTLKAVRTRVKDHVKPLDEASLTGLVAFDAGAALAVKRILGVQKKKTYLGAIDQEQVKTSLNDLGVMKQKLGRTRTKLGRSKYQYKTWTRAEAERMVGPDRSDRWHKRRQKIDEARTRIVEFHHYDRWDPVRDMLWWDVMTDGRLDGNFIPEVRDHHHHAHHHHQEVASHREQWQRDRDVDIS
jgi:hypothetical protein